MPSGPGPAKRGRGARDKRTPSGATYAAAGVDIEAGERAVDAIRELVRSTYRPEVLGDIGGFGGLFSVPGGYRDPVLVAATDGVGTKLAIAQALGDCRTIGIDLVAMCVDDLVCQGAEPLFFLDYLSTGKVDPEQVHDILEGIAEGCRQAGCAILGGEMAEHPGLLAPGAFDVAGFAVGIVERDEILRRERVAVGDVLVGLPSPGLRSNGYSLARGVLLDMAGRSLHEPAFPSGQAGTGDSGPGPASTLGPGDSGPGPASTLGPGDSGPGPASTLGQELLRPSVIYSPAVLALLRSQGQNAVDVHGVAHITGGGLPGNLPRALPAGCHAVLHRRAWNVPPIFGLIQAAGRVTDDEMARVFNLGVGMIVVVPGDQAGAAIGTLTAAGQPGAGVIGEVVAGDGPVTFED